MLCGELAPRSSVAAPVYPSVYEDSGRTGEVATICDYAHDGSMTHCRLLGVEGGDAFGDAVLAWLRQDSHNFHLARNFFDPKHSYLITTLSPAPAPVFDGVPVAGGKPAFPSSLFRVSGTNKAIADCFIATHGSPSDCRMLDGGAKNPFSKAALAWLRSGKVRFELASPDLAGKRHIFYVQFTTGNHG
jgi:hypothetical protein